MGQMIEFFLILQAINPDIGAGMFFRLLIGTVLMLLFGYMGEALIIDPWVGFGVGIAGWVFILAEVFVVSTPAGVEGASDAVKSAFNLMRFIVTAGWCIYPAGYFFGYLQGDVSDSPLNLIYNLADFVNKIWFCLAIWNAAKTETIEKNKKNVKVASLLA